jgi:diamine N-acetyltransferase
MKENDIYIRPLQESDALISCKWRNNPEIWKYTGSKPNKYITPEIEMEWIKDVLKQDIEKRFAICLKKNDKYIGNAQLTDIENGTAQYHLFIGETQYWGMGIGTKVAELIKFKAFKSIGLNKIYSFFVPENKSSIRTCEKNGFVFNGFINGKIRMTCPSATFLS